MSLQDIGLILALIFMAIQLSILSKRQIEILEYLKKLNREATEPFEKLTESDLKTPAHPAVSGPRIDEGNTEELPLAELKPDELSEDGFDHKTELMSVDEFRRMKTLMTEKEISMRMKQKLGLKEISLFLVLAVLCLVSVGILLIWQIQLTP